MRGTSRRPGHTKEVRHISTLAPTLSVTDLRGLVVSSLDDDKALDVVTINLDGKSSIADCMVIATGTSTRHVASLADHVVEKLRDAGHDYVAVEGMSQCDWVLVDAGDVIVHLFRPEIRQFYDLEKMWQVPGAPDAVHA